MRAARVVALSLAVALLGGCVYYNGMYNTKRLAGSARKAERDGRTFEANNLWGQVITRAESLVTRHPDSKYVDEALVLKGVALSRLNQCEAAVAPLGRVSLLPSDSEVVEEAALALGRCQLQLGDPAVAETMFARVVESEDPARRRDARLLRARALRESGRPQEAVAALEGADDPRAANERLLALAGARQRDAALALADSMLAAGDTTVQWDSLVVAVGREDPATASTLVDRLDAGPGTLPVVRARLLLEDGLRLEGVDSARSHARLRQAAAMDSTGDAGERARLRLTRLDLARTASISELPPLAKELDARIARRGMVSGEAGQLREAVGRILAAGDSASAGAAQSDLRLFLAAETARDSLAAPALAASLFRTIVEGTPDSPYAPKAILAGTVLDPVWGESAVVLLEQRYAASPYVSILRGEEPYGYRELEDSLQSFSFGGGIAPPPDGRRPAAGRDSLGTPSGSAPRPRRGLEP
ncbi:MAG TPA: tetratricopeptide repeat protein [Gemmatimonadales bacterium]|jgi:predicted negative regulator of RcsB-dependent stress response|nr:tetratricopeptide repeat protein [Gemmatimonadales bacterium]